MAGHFKESSIKLYLQLNTNHNSDIIEKSEPFSLTSIIVLKKLKTLLLPQLQQAKVYIQRSKKGLNIKHN